MFLCLHLKILGPYARVECTKALAKTQPREMLCSRLAHSVFVMHGVLVGNKEEEDSGFIFKQGFPFFLLVFVHAHYHFCCLCWSGHSLNINRWNFCLLFGVFSGVKKAKFAVCLIFLDWVACHQVCFLPDRKPQWGFFWGKSLLCFGWEGCAGTVVCRGRWTSQMG